MATWQFWMLFGVLLSILLALVGIHTATKDLWTKLHRLQEQIAHTPLDRDNERSTQRSID